MDEKERYQSPVLYGNVADYDTGPVRYIAHWLWWVGDACYSLAVGKEQGSAGLESSPLKHPDQKFWKQKTLIAKPHKSAIIVTDCKLLPCSKGSGCAYHVPFLVKARLGADIPIGVFCHSDYGDGLGKFGYFTESGASIKDINSSMEDMFTWDWDADSDGATYDDEE
ncbi:hypothetical protein R0381_001210 [Jeongeupia wiesaeckerbachi]|uniref:hypothetical protein n=1 Tax=Jeongeupia wiesaeckerbachi TaxID=3051218 RepID=UPI003D806C1F